MRSIKFYGKLLLTVGTLLGSWTPPHAADGAQRVCKDDKDCDVSVGKKWFNSDCYAVNRKGEKLGYIPYGVGCPTNYTSYKMTGVGCYGILPDGSVGGFQDASKCGKVAAKKWFNGNCYAVDGKDEKLGYQPLGSGCPANYINYVFAGISCHGKTPDGQLGGRVEPYLCEIAKRFYDEKKMECTDCGSTASSVQAGERNYTPAQ